jgi:hypothetical protein
MTSTLQLSNKLKGMKMPDDQAEFLAETLINLPEQNLATKVDIAELRGDITAGFARLEGRLNGINVHLAIHTALILGLLWKAFK